LAFDFWRLSRAHIYSVGYKRWPFVLSILWTCLYYSWIVSELVIAVATRTPQSSGKVRDRGSQLLLWIVIVVSITACEWLRRIMPANILGGAPWLRPASLALLVVALAIRWSAIINLGRSFSANVAIRDAQKIQTTGLYHFVRHPSYLGLLLVFFAIGVHSRIWIGLALAVIPPTAALLYRIRIEEAALIDAFGPEYIAYSRKTKRLISGLY
jgi:protein-S-isoprenylcysteine O-methyltransferase Ste14